MLFCYSSGEPTAPAIVFLHGAGLSGRMWQPQMDRLREYYCLAPDLPEQGKSLKIGPFRLEDAARQVIELIDERIPRKRAHLVGLSLGADLALAVMKLAPEYVDHAVVSAAAPMGKTLGKCLVMISTLPINFLFFEQQSKLSARMLGIPEAYRAMFSEDLVLSVNPAFTRRSIEALMDLQQMLPCESTVPTLVAVGEKENGLAKHGAKRVAQCLKKAHGVIVPGVNHVWNLQAPELFTNTIRAWIEDRPLPGVLRPLLKVKTSQ